MSDHLLLWYTIETYLAVLISFSVGHVCYFRISLLNRLLNRTKKSRLSEPAGLE